MSRKHLDLKQRPVRMISRKKDGLGACCFWSSLPSTMSTCFPGVFPQYTFPLMRGQFSLLQHVGNADCFDPFISVESALTSNLWSHLWVNTGVPNAGKSHHTFRSSSSPGHQNGIPSETPIRQKSRVFDGFWGYKKCQPKINLIFLIIYLEFQPAHLARIQNMILPKLSFLTSNAGKRHGKYNCVGHVHLGPGSQVISVLFTRQLCKVWTIHTLHNTFPKPLSPGACPCIHYLYLPP